MERAQRIIDLGVAAVIGSVSVMAVAGATAAWEWPMMAQLNGAAKARLGDTLRRVVDQKERVVLRTGTRSLAAVIPMEDLRLLEKLQREAEERNDVRAARRALNEGRRKGTKSLAAFKRELKILRCLGEDSPSQPKS